MGHPASNERLEFINVRIDCGNGRTWHVCKHSDRAYKDSRQPNGTYNTPEPNRIKGRVENFRSHLKSCQAFISYVRANSTTVTPSNPANIGTYDASSGFMAQRLPSDGVDTQQQPTAKRQRRIDEFYAGISEDDETKVLERLILQFQDDTNIPDSFIERPSIARLLHHANTMTGSIDSRP
ncbi:hypothetical protein F442_18292 [Phytophthora nicotianae P10297]|uniref:Uncharacterized protein n=1 Tax=Phytophthora nicotianae P10297 TaxID=1317064 RepID=W2YG04_PHYNI|nr:hypothetical protein F442_18292 [Phytophthora nicotianae P10297]